MGNVMKITFYKGYRLKL